MPKFGVVSLGCSKNRVDSEMMMGYLTAAGYELTHHPEQAHIIIVNTCGFIEPAKQESIDTVLEMNQYKNGRCSVLVMTGCLSQRYMEELKAELPEVDIMLGVNQYRSLPALLDAYFPGRVKKYASEPKRVLSTPPHYAYLRIADGCDNRCAYCAIPLIRGNYVSRPMEEIVGEAVELTRGGVKELVVIAQDTTRYGLDLYGERRLPQLLDRLCRESSARWIRLMYTYSDDITGELLDVMTKYEQLVKYIDIPVQHADDVILKNMNRRGSNASLKALMEDIRRRDGRFVLRTSFIVGFPGETEEQFETLRSFIETHPFDRAGVFAYSMEDGTAACAFEGQVTEDVIQGRLDRLMRTQMKVAKRLNENRVGTTVDVLVEGFDNQRQSYYGRSYAEAPDVDGVILFKSAQPISAGEFVSVRLTQAMEYDLIGVVTNESPK